MQLESKPTPERLDLPPRTRAERRMARLEQMADMGVEIGRALKEQVAIASNLAQCTILPDNRPSADLLNDTARAFAQVGRVVSLLSAVEDRIEKGLPVLPEVDHARRLREDAVQAKRARIFGDLDVEFGADRDVSPRRQADLRIGLHRLLDIEAADFDRFLSRPLPEMIAGLRRDLGLDPIDDGDLWTEDRETDSSTSTTPTRLIHSRVEAGEARWKPGNPPPTTSSQRFAANFPAVPMKRGDGDRSSRLGSRASGRAQSARPPPGE